MGEKSVTIQLPDELYESVQQAASSSERPLEEVLLESIGVLFRRPSSDLDGMLVELADYSDSQL